MWVWQKDCSGKPDPRNEGNALNFISWVARKEGIIQPGMQQLIGQFGIIVGKILTQFWDISG
jgi:hypothetical protein